MPRINTELTPVARLLCAVFATVALSVTALPGAQAAGVSGQGTWETTLQGRDLDGNTTTFEAYYDTALDITWLADAQYAVTSGFDSEGFLDWGTARDWASNLSVHGVGGWRLPKMVDLATPGCTFAYDVEPGQPVDCGSTPDLATSELAHLFFTSLGNTDYVYPDPEPEGFVRDQDSYNRLTNTGPFVNFKTGHYWIGLDYPDQAETAWVFDTLNASQGLTGMYPGWYTMVVRSGDVSAVVPEPQTHALMGLGLGLGLVAAQLARKRR